MRFLVTPVRLVIASPVPDWSNQYVCPGHRAPGGADRSGARGL